MILRVSLLLSVILVTRPLPAAEPAQKPVPVIFDTDIMGDVDDAGTVALLHALANRGEVQILAMGVCVKNPWCPLCLDALNTYFGRPDIPLGVVKGPAHSRASKYAQAISEEFPHALKSADDAPDAALLYRRVLAAQPDGSVVLVSVGQLTNCRNLLQTGADQHSNLTGVELVQRKVRTWVCMGGRFPEGREANFINDGPAAAYAVKHWPTPIVFTGWEIGNEIMTGANLRNVPTTSPVRRAYELYNGLKDRQSWDQTAVLYAVRGLDGGLADYWDGRSTGHLEVAADGSNVWRHAPDRDHSYLGKKMPPDKIARVIEAFMLEPPSPKQAAGSAAARSNPPQAAGATRVARWKDDKRAAFLLMFDDSMPSHVKNVVPELKKRGLVGTFYVNPGKGEWQAFRDAWEKEIPSTGMEYGNHTMTHKGVRDVADADNELRQSNEVITRLFPTGKQPRLISWGQPGVAKGAWNITAEQLNVLLAKHHLIDRPTFDRHGAAIHAKTGDEMMRLADQALAHGSVEHIIFHGVGGEWISVALPEFTVLLDKLAAKRDQLWVTTHIPAHQYATERDTAEVRVLQADDRQLRLQLTCKADAKFYDYPLTQITQVPATWKQCEVVQGATKATLATVNGTVRYAAVPNGPPIILQPAEKP